MLIKLIQRFTERKYAYMWAGVGVLLVGVLGILDYLTGNEVAFSLFYVVPIMLVTLAVNETAGFLLAILSAQVLMTAEVAAGQRYSHWIIYVWNVLIRMGLFSFFAFLVASLQESRREEQLAARTDFVTGAVNARYFHEMLQMELDRIRRYPQPLTVVFIDIDNFKTINDTFGHPMGDKVLRFIADELRSQLRRTDVVARVGGDEFALLLPSLRQPEAEVVLSKVRAGLAEALQRQNMPLTLSVGAVTCLNPPQGAHQVIHLADELMYSVKHSTKNDIRFMTIEGL